jgi:hypothetical protein
MKNSCRFQDKKVLLLCRYRQIYCTNRKLVHLVNRQKKNIRRSCAFRHSSACDRLQDRQEGGMKKEEEEHRVGSLLYTHRVCLIAPSFAICSIVSKVVLVDLSFVCLLILLDNMLCLSIQYLRA